MFELEIGVPVSRVGKLDDYIILLDNKGKLITLQHDNTHCLIVMHDLKATDMVFSWRIISAH